MSRRARAELADGKPVSRAAAAVIVAIWVGLAVLAVLLIARAREVTRAGKREYNVAKSLMGV